MWSETTSRIAAQPSFKASVHGTGRGAKGDTCGGSGVAVRHGISRIIFYNSRLVLPRCLRHGEVQSATVF
ncbi:MAG: hypothetical protein K2J82_10490 [Muribaculaceae bacterium]|nr:hypothetical protein [Muribaculaceae bacterium]